jgi:positive regulator of sigma E activity
MSNPSTLEHDGIVKSIDNGTIFVDIEVVSACASCHAKGYCSAFGKSDKVIEIPSEKYPDIIPGDHVTVIIRESLGMQALLIGYIIPVAVVLFVLFLSFSLTKDEGVAALISIGAVGLYYVALLLLKNRFKKHFTFTLEKKK